MTKNTRRISRTLSIDLRNQLTAIGLNQKPSYLWEISFGDCDHVIDVCEELNIDLNGLQVIHINDTLFIAKRQSLISHLNYLFTDSFTAFIDVSPDLPSPQLMSEEQIADNKSFLRKIFNEINLNDNKTKFKIDLSGQSMADMCLISGSLLGYPVIYSNRDPENGNCLSFEPLSHFCLQKSTKILYSFSCPQKYRQLFENQINSWFESIKCRTISKDLSLIEELKVMPLVLT